MVKLREYNNKKSLFMLLNHKKILKKLLKTYLWTEFNFPQTLFKCSDIFCTPVGNRHEIILNKTLTKI